jgi:nickel/cobalt exporter
VRRIRRLGVVAGLALVSLLIGTPASAHPLGNFTINLYSGLVLDPDRLVVNYVVDMAEIPTVQEMFRIDADGDGSPSAAEGASYAARKAEQLVAAVTASQEGRSIALRVRSSSVSFPPGQAGLPTLRLEAVFEGAAAGTAPIEFRDANYGDRIGWREITAVGADGQAVRTSSVPARSISEALRRYPESLLSSPLRVTSADVTVEPGTAVRAPAGQDPGGAPDAQTGSSAFAGLATWTGLSLPVFLAALLLAAGFGAGHALLPGHGKTIMAAYLVTAGSRIRHAVAIGAAVAFMHTASVLGVGLVILGAERFVSPERIYPWLSVASGVVVLALGGALLSMRLRARAAGTGGHGHGHDHAHPVLSRRSLAALAVSGGILPSPTAVLVLLSTIAAHRVAFGLSLILAFSVGLAAALVGVGVAVLRAREFVLPRLNGGVARLAPVLGAVVIVGAGLYLTGSGLGRL